MSKKKLEIEHELTEQQIVEALQKRYGALFDSSKYDFETLKNIYLINGRDVKIRQ